MSKLPINLNDLLRQRTLRRTPAAHPRAAAARFAALLLRTRGRRPAVLAVQEVRLREPS